MPLGKLFWSDSTGFRTRVTVSLNPHSKNQTFGILRRPLLLGSRVSRASLGLRCRKRAGIAPPFSFVRPLFRVFSHCSLSVRWRFLSVPSRFVWLSGIESAARPAWFRAAGSGGAAAGQTGKSSRPVPFPPAHGKFLFASSHRLGLTFPALYSILILNMYSFFALHGCRCAGLFLFALRPF